jgi:hypothetical protein
MTAMAFGRDFAKALHEALGTAPGRTWLASIRPAVITVAVLFQPAPAGSNVCEFRTPDRHRLPELDQAVVPA